MIKLFIVIGMALLLAGCSHLPRRSQYSTWDGLIAAAVITSAIVAPRPYYEPYPYYQPRPYWAGSGRGRYRMSRNRLMNIHRGH